MCGYLKKYLESCPQGWQAITIRQLMSHTSGLVNQNQIDAGGLGYSEFRDCPPAIHAGPK